MTEQTQQGTGKHGHKDTQEPWPHHEGSGHGSEHAAAEDRDREGGEEREGSRPDGTSRVERKSESEGDDLKSREYEDESGETHHHTRTYQEQHGGESSQQRHSSER